MFQKMKEVSYWALLNPIKSQVLIAFSQIILTFLAIDWGIRFFEEDIHLPYSWRYIRVALFTISAILYPIRRAKYRFWRLNYVRQKTLDFTLNVSFAFMVTIISNNHAFLSQRPLQDDFQVQNIVFQENRDNNPVKNINQPPPNSRKAWKKMLHEEYKKYVAERKAKVSDRKITFGSFMLGFLVILVITALSCFLGCVAGEAALFIFIVGFIGAIWAGVATMRAAGRKKDNYQPMPKEG